MTDHEPPKRVAPAPATATPPLRRFDPRDAQRRTGAELLELLSGLPKPDEEFLAAVEVATRTQRSVEKSPWES